MLCWFQDYMLFQSLLRSAAGSCRRDLQKNPNMQVLLQASNQATIEMKLKDTGPSRQGTVHSGCLNGESHLPKAGWMVQLQLIIALIV